jgi:cytochrome oxidase Cu insertion factor (SCO1/SenC/PrrC family)
MPGMDGGVSPGNNVLQTAFKAALLNQGVIALLVFVVLAIAWVACRELLPARARVQVAARQAGLRSEPAGRRLLRIGFGVLWIFDGLLQAQPKMAGGLPSQVIAPAAAGSPGWVAHLVNWAGTGWSYHPVQDAAGAVWIQLGIGAWMIASARGRSSRLAGLAGAGWGLVVWVFGEALGGMLAPGQSLLTGAPGGALIYCVAGVLIALPDRCWRTAALGRRSLQVLGGCLAVAAVYQAWPGRGYWQGTLAGQPGSLTSMVGSMASTPQPRPLARLVADFGSLVAAHGFAVNLVAVVVLAAAGFALLTGRVAIARPAVVALVVFFLADWILVEDLGFFGGLGTDPNNMIPLALLVTGAFLAVARVPAPEPAAQAAPAGPQTTVAPAGPQTAMAPAGPQPTVAPDPASAPSPPAPPVPSPAPRSATGPGRRLGIALGTARASVVIALWAAAIMVLGAAPLAVAETQRTASPIIASALNGPPTTLDTPAAPFSLTDQDGRPVSLASLRGRVVLLTFLDPVCTSDCPLLAQEFRAADQILGGQASRVALVAVVANPVYRSVAYTRAFDRQERLTGLRNWYFLTGSLQQLAQTWTAYYVTAQLNGPGAMALHPDLAYVIDASGNTRTELNLDPGPGTATSESSFAAELAQAAQRVMAPA